MKQADDDSLVGRFVMSLSCIQVGKAYYERLSTARCINICYVRLYIPSKVGNRGSLSRLLAHLAIIPPSWLIEGRENLLDSLPVGCLLSLLLFLPLALLFDRGNRLTLPVCDDNTDRHIARRCKKTCERHTRTEGCWKLVRNTGPFFQNSVYPFLRTRRVSY